MKNYIKLILAALLFVSCGDKDNSLITPVKKKNLERIIIAPEYMLQLKSKEIYIGLRYFKDYNDKDDISITFNGQSGIQLSEASSAIEGNNLFFKFPALAQTGDFKIKCTVKNDQNSITKELTLRLVDNFDISTVWSSLDKAYATSFVGYADRLKTTNEYTLRTLYNTGTTISFGVYADNLGNLNQYVTKPFLPALPGAYNLFYEGIDLKEIRIHSGDPTSDQNFSPPKFYADMAAVYGSPISENNTSSGKITVYNSGNYILTVTETPTLISTSIIKA
jgi:hypothetical protein